MKDMRTGEQVEVPADQVAGWLRLHTEQCRVPTMTATSLRTHRAGDVGPDQRGQDVTLYGWSPAAATTAGSCSSTSATWPASSRSLRPELLDRHA